MDIKNKKIIWIIVLTVVLLCVCCVVAIVLGYFGYVNFFAPKPVSGVNAQPVSAAEQVADQFMNALVAGDYQAAGKLLAPGIIGYVDPTELKKYIDIIGSGTLIKWVRNESKNEGSAVIVIGIIQRNQENTDVKLTMEEKDGKWIVANWEFTVPVNIP
jgi:hypothetical protein